MVASVVDLPDTSVFPINTAHTFGYEQSRFAYDLDASNTTEVLLAGSIFNYDSGGNVPLVKYNPTNRLAWAIDWDSGFTDIYPTVSFTPDGSIVMACSSKMILLDEMHIFHSIVKFNSSGEIVWQRKWGSLDRDVIHWGPFIEPASDGDYFIYDGLHLGDTDTDYKALLTKLSSNGLVRYQQTFHVSEAEREVITAGVGGEEGEFYALGGSGFEDPADLVRWFAEIDAEGNLVWAKRLSILNERFYDIAYLYNFHIKGKRL